MRSASLMAFASLSFEMSHVGTQQTGGTAGCGGSVGRGQRPDQALPAGQRLAGKEALVGESGSGKSTLARLLIKLIEPTRGTIRYEGENIFALSRPDVRRLRRKVQIVFQDPYSSLNPRHTVR